MTCFSGRDLWRDTNPPSRFRAYARVFAGSRNKVIFPVSALLLPRVAIALVLSLFMQTAYAAQTYDIPEVCRAFTKTFPEAAEFAVKDWTGQSGGERLLKIAAEGEIPAVPDHKVSLNVDPDTGKPVEIVLPWANAPVPLDADGKIEEGGVVRRSNKAFRVDLTKWDAKQKQAFFDTTDVASRMKAAHVKTGSLFLFEESRQKVLKRTLFEAALAEFEIAAGQDVTVKDFDSATGTVTLVTRPSARLQSGDTLNLRFKLPNPMSLTMALSDLNRGGLQVRTPRRSVERTSLKLAVSHSNVPFGQNTFRGCIAVKAGNAIGTSWENLKPDEIKWIEIENVMATPAAPGSADLDIEIPVILESKNEVDFTPTPLATLNQLLFGGTNNARILIFAANGDGMTYNGLVSHYIDDRWAAVLISLVAFFAAYIVTVAIWSYRKPAATSPPTNVAAYPRVVHIRQNLWPLKAVRGHNGTASISNLQILWWSLAVFGLMIYVWVASGGMASLNQTIMWLLGIGGTGSLAAKAVAINLKQNNPSLAAAGANPEDVTVKAWDLISVNGRLDLTKLQMLLFTIVAGVFVVTNVWSQIAFPEIPTELLTLMGISNGVYVLGKLTKTDPLAANPAAILAGLQYQLVLTDDLIATQTKKQTDLETQISTLKEGLSAEELTAIKDRLSPLEEELGAVVNKLKDLQAQKKQVEADVAVAKKKLADADK